MTLTAIVLAAGQGKRFGGLKQAAPIGPNGETITEYAAHAAREAGFERFVVVIREDIREPMTEVTDRIKGIEVRLALQPFPGGTGHAILAAADDVDGAFAAGNADDLYDPASWQAVADHLRATPEEVAVVTYPLARTLSDEGTVSRGVCRVAGDNRLLEVDEILKISSTDSGPFDTTTDTYLAPDAQVSLNFWAFPGAAVEWLAEGWAAHDQESGEYLLPTVVDGWLRRGGLTGRTLPARGEWVGVTHAADLSAAQARMRALVEQGAYPASLWS